MPSPLLIGKGENPAYLYPRMANRAQCCHADWLRYYRHLVCSESFPLGHVTLWKKALH